MDEGNSPYSDSKDRISALPDNLIHSILSFIDMRYAVQTSVLSKRWRYTWTSLTTLNFNQEEGCSNIADFVNMVLMFRDSCRIQRFCLEVYSDEVVNSTHIYSWIAAAVWRNVEELDISCVCNGDFVIPPCLCTCKSLKKLDLYVCGDEDYPGKIVLPTSVSLPKLKSMSLNLEYLFFEDECSTNEFFSSCPALESLDLGGCTLRDMNLNISSLILERFGSTIYHDGSMHLDTSSFTGRPRLRLYAPNLTTLDHTRYELRDYSFGNLSSLVSACIYLDVETDDKMPGSNIELLSEKKELYARCMMKLVRTLHNVKSLALSGYFQVLSGATEILDSPLPQFLNLRTLRLTTWLSRDCMHSIIFFLKISPNIESLCLDMNAILFDTPPLFPYCDEINDSRSQKDFWDSGLSLPCMLYHLKFVKIRGLRGCVNELKFIEILLKNSMILEEVVLCSIKKNPRTERRMVKFNEIVLTFPRASACTIFLNPSSR